MTCRRGLAAHAINRGTLIIGPEAVNLAEFCAYDENAAHIVPQRP